MISRWPDGAQWPRNKGSLGVNRTPSPPPRVTMPDWSTARGPCRPGHVALSWPAGVPGARAQVAAGLDLRLKRFAHTLNGRDGGAREGRDGRHKRPVCRRHKDVGVLLCTAADTPTAAADGNNSDSNNSDANNNDNELAASGDEGGGGQASTCVAASRFRHYRRT